MIKRLLPALFLAIVPGVVYALGLGNLQLESALNEPLHARIELLSATAEELSSLHVDLAGEDAFNHAGIPRNYVLKQLRFSVKESEAGPDYILVTSDDPIREPFLNFLVEVNWSKGRLYREYTVLLDPPIYVTEQGRKTVTPPPVTTTKQQASDQQATGVSTEKGHTVIYNPEYKPTAQRELPPSPTVAYTGGDYGPVESGDTLWSIARAMRPDSSVSIQQMMLALLRTNPDAFINNNINGLKRGYVLKAPELSDARSISKDEAFAQASTQNSLWEEGRQAIAEAPPVRPEGAPAQPEAVVTEPTAPAEEAKAEKPAAPVTAETKPELRLVAPGAEGKSAEQGGTAEPGEQALTKELALATETLEALTQENTELKSKITESDAILADINRLITLKQNELAALQQQVAGKAAGKEAAAPVSKAAVKEKPQPEKTAAAPAPAKAKPAPATKPAPAKSQEGKAPATKAKEEKAGPESSIISTLLAVISGLVEQIRNNFIYIAGALGALLVVFLGAYFYRRRGEAAVEIPQETYAEYSEEPTVASGSEDITDLKAAAESEAITILPGQDSEATQIPAATATGAARESVVVADADPLEEVNVFLAYEHFDQAEEFVKNALEKEPDNLAYHSKLLEVYYTANNKKAYEQAARVLYDKVQGKGDYWNMAQAMWQVLSPNRALFAAPAAGEEAAEVETAKAGGGIVNIAGEGEGAARTGLDLDLDTTGGGATAGDTLEVETAEVEPDVLDVTAAIATADSEILDVTAAVDIDTEVGGPAEKKAVATAADEGALDFSLDLEEEKAPEEEKSLDISLDLLQPEDETTASPAKNIDDDALEFSLDLGEEEGKEEEAENQDLDFSLSSGAEAAQEESHTGSALLDVTSSIDSGVDVEELSRTGAGLLDVTSASSIEESEAGSAQEIAGDAGEGLMDMSMPGPAQGAADMLDVTSATDFDLETGQDLLDVTSAGSVADVGKGDDSGLDFELAPDKPVPGDESALAFEGIDLTADTGGGASGLELELEPGPESAEEAFEMDMDSTMQIPTKRSTLSGTAKEDVTFRVPSTSGGAPSDEDEIATQLDLAKAYIELGNAESARTILGEIIAVGNAEQKQQAQELLGQIA